MNYYVFPGLGKVGTVSTSSALDVVLALTGLSLSQLQAKTRKREVVTARALVAGLLEDKIDAQPLVDLLYPGRPNNRNQVKGLTKLHHDLMETNIVYRNIAKQAHQLYARTDSLQTADSTA